MILADVAPLYAEEPLDDPVNPASLGKLSNLLATGEINSNTGRKVLKALMEEDFDPTSYVSEHDLAQINDREKLQETVDDSIAANERAIKDYLGGKDSAIRAIVGRVMKDTGGRANPILVETMIKEAIGGR